MFAYALAVAEVTLGGGGYGVCVFGIVLDAEFALVVAEFEFPIPTTAVYLGYVVWCPDGISQPIDPILDLAREVSSLEFCIDFVSRLVGEGEELCAGFYILCVFGQELAVAAREVVELVECG